jgi:hypothetical protein
MARFVRLTRAHDGGSVHVRVAAVTMVCESGQDPGDGEALPMETDYARKLREFPVRAYVSLAGDPEGVAVTEDVAHVLKELSLGDEDV